MYDRASKISVQCIIMHALYGKKHNIRPSRHCRFWTVMEVLLNMTSRDVMITSPWRTLATGLHTTGRVDCVTKQAVPRHRQTHHTGTYRPCKHDARVALVGNMAIIVGNFRHVKSYMNVCKLWSLHFLMVIDRHAWRHRYAPVLMPIRSCSWWFGRWRTVNWRVTSRSVSAMNATWLACSCPFLTGSPDTTMYASPIVSTCITS